jgi:hypothetical protein
MKKKYGFPRVEFHETQKESIDFLDLLRVCAEFYPIRKKTWKYGISLRWFIALCYKNK